MYDEDEDYHGWNSPLPSIELSHKSIDYELYLWLTGERYNIVLWERREDANHMLKCIYPNDNDDAMHLFALFMNELEMYDAR
jgi:hypothetical protein